MDLSGQNIVDLSVLAVLLVSGILAFLRGFVRELFALGTWVGASVASVMFYPQAKPFVAAYIKNPMAADAATAMGLFCGALVILIPVGNLFASLIRGETLTAIDRSLGFVFGVVRGGLILCLLYLCASWLWPTDDKQPAMLANAKSRPALVAGAEILKDLIPKGQVDKASEQLLKTQGALENVKRLQEISTPTPVPPAGAEPAPTYTDPERRKMDELIQQIPATPPIAPPSMVPTTRE